VREKRIQFAVNVVGVVGAGVCVIPVEDPVVAGGVVVWVPELVVDGVVGVVVPVPGDVVVGVAG